MGGTGLFGYRLGSESQREQIVGLREVQMNLAKLGSDAKNDMKPAHKKAAEIVVAGARRFVPIQTGALRDSLRAIARQKAGVVRVGSASVPYAGPIHFGWPARRIRPNPFIYDALDERRSEVVRLYDERMREVIKKHGLGLGPPHYAPSALLGAIK